MLYRILLHLARNHDFPEGSSARGYEIVAPLDASGRLDAQAWRKHEADCRVRRFWAGEDDRLGRLIHHAGGAGGATWKIDYDPSGPDEDETGYRLDTHRFIENEYVTIRDDEGHPHTFKIAKVRPA
jgi:hypothetical protein